MCSVDALRGRGALSGNTDLTVIPIVFQTHFRLLHPLFHSFSRTPP